MIPAKAQVDAGPAKRLGERAHRGARIDMAFAGEEEPAMEAPGKVRLERRNMRLVDALVAKGAGREPLDFAGVARRRYDQRAGAHDARRAARPPVDRAGAERDNLGRRAFAFAERREHAARKPGGVGAKRLRALDERDSRAALGER